MVYRERNAGKEDETIRNTQLKGGHIADTEVLRITTQTDESYLEQIRDTVPISAIADQPPYRKPK
jgi:hypothetical protein